MKRVLFSSRSVIELLKGSIKILILGGIAFSVIKNRFEEILEVILMPFNKLAETMGDIGFEILTKVGGLFLIIAFADYFYQK